MKNAPKYSATKEMNRAAEATAALEALTPRTRAFVLSHFITPTTIHTEPTKRRKYTKRHPKWKAKKSKKS